jgi:hypothetical protein
MIGVVGKGPLLMMDILKQRRNTRRLLISNIYEGTLGKSMGSTIDEVISERVLTTMTCIMN